ncbi:uncharacterized protein LOC130663082 isoform X2 [Microplitis mediator]|uniref:uncharacterized protein LOC130663082 isoform X2 n=1 Tax=Microplitis mediator TaxID=375433 RepID=UPI00255677B2|nr:uncharacterized protein LOC130663082 isoform X2 [Microplitis mediator]
MILFIWMMIFHFSCGYSLEKNESLIGRAIKEKINFGNLTEFNFGNLTEVNLGNLTEVNLGNLTEVKFGNTTDKIEFENTREKIEFKNTTEKIRFENSAEIKFENSTEKIKFENLIEEKNYKNVVWIMIEDFDEFLINKLNKNKLFTAKGFYQNCNKTDDCNCNKKLNNNINDLITWTRFIKKINIGTISQRKLTSPVIYNNFKTKNHRVNNKKMTFENNHDINESLINRTINRDDADLNGLWDLLDFFTRLRLSFLKRIFPWNSISQTIPINSLTIDNIFNHMVNDFKLFDKQFLLITFTPKEFLDKILNEINETIIISGVCGNNKEIAYFATENSKIFESIKTIYEIPNVIKSILNNCNGICNNTLEFKFKKRFIRSTDDEIIPDDKIEDEPEIEMILKSENPEIHRPIYQKIL